MSELSPPLSLSKQLQELRKNVAVSCAERDTLASTTPISLAKLITHAGKDESLYLPTTFALSSLFAPTRRGPREPLAHEVFHFWSSMQITAAGSNLDWSDCVTFMAILTFCRKRNLALGKAFSCRSIELLRLCHPNRKEDFGSNDVRCLKNSLNRLNQASITVRYDPRNGTSYNAGEHCPFLLVKNVQSRKDSSNIEILLDSRIGLLLANEQYIVVNSRKLNSLPSELAKTLYLTLVASKESEQKFWLSDLCKKLRYTSSTQVVKCRLTKALAQLAEANIVDNYSWDRCWNSLLQRNVFMLLIEKHSSIVPPKKSHQRSQN